MLQKVKMFWCYVWIITIIPNNIRIFDFIKETCIYKQRRTAVSAQRSFKTWKKKQENHGILTKYSKRVTYIPAVYNWNVFPKHNPSFQQWLLKRNTTRKWHTPTWRQNRMYIQFWYHIPKWKLWIKNP